ncbi:hypothetical protein X975_20069, partial [Stegodyphus mimosarum]
SSLRHLTGTTGRAENLQNAPVCLLHHDYVSLFID